MTLQEIMLQEKPEVVKKAKAIASEMLLNIHLAEFREKVQLTQNDIAQAMSVKQPTVAGMGKNGHDIINVPL